MGSMSYCKYRNALKDLRELEDYLSEDHSLDHLSDEEDKARDACLHLMGELNERFGE